ncbi:MAG TPA: monofunctional biosynthetic peptidoglycan transglycosylase [Burkholderiales bacterium]|jgi:monofunctional biosynthetic peptidoglycan transglycosylase|nr:monofunctional biosynthetic peptidoglycan transglycosylase [Burkholderiales bacterium]
MTYVGRLLGRLLVLAAALLLIYQSWLFGHVVWWVWFNPKTTAFMDARLEVLRDANPKAKLQHQWVPYENISVHLKRALIAAEDAKFLDHEGFDWEAIQEAAEKNLRRGKVVAGGSTISQQLAKNLFLSGRRTPWRKLQEAAITVMIETVMSKRRILEIYLNVIEWGNGVFGVEAAARHYFGTSATWLSPWQAAQLAAMVPRPRFYDRVRSTPLLQRRTAAILERMEMVQVP